MRAYLSAAVVLVFLAGTTLAQNQNQNPNTNPNVNPTQKTQHKGHVHKAKIVNIDSKKGTVTLQFKGKDGKSQTRTFHLTEDIEYADSTGRVAQVELFRSGDEVLVVEEKGKLRSVTRTPHQKGKKTGADNGAGSGSQPTQPAGTDRSRK